MAIRPLTSWISRKDVVLRRWEFDQLEEGACVQGCVSECRRRVQCGDTETCVYMVMVWQEHNIMHFVVPF